MEKMKNEFEINADNINIEDIMKQIRENINKRGYKEEKRIEEFDFSPEEIKGENTHLHHLWNINLEKEIVSNGAFGKIKIFFKKVIRKLTRWYIKPMMEEQVNFNAVATRAIDYLYKENERMKKESEAKILELKEKNTNISNKLLILEEKSKEDDFNMDYLAFENKYRGPKEGIKELQSKFLKYFEGKDNILDIGSGRGEFIELLIENGKKQVLGIDLNRQMIERCQETNLPVKHYDGVKYLEENDNLKLGGIFSSQVIEHLKPSQISKLIKNAYKNLEEGGVLIMETINPMCLVTHAMTYPLDLTHKQLVHPFTIAMLLEEYGFKNIDFIYSSRNDKEVPLLKIEGIDESKLEKYNEKIKRMYELIFGYQDYAVVAWK